MLDSFGDAESLRLRAEVWLALGRYAEARDTLLLVSSPHTVSAWLGKVGSVQAQTGDYSKATQILSVAHGLGPLDMVASQAYATSLQHTGQLDLAVAVMREAIRAQPTNAAAHYALAGALWQAHPGDAEAVTEAEHAVEIQDYFLYRFRLGLFYAYLGRLSDAEIQFRLVLQTGVDRFDALVQLGDVSAAQGRDSEAAESYGQALTLLEREDVRARLSRACDKLKIGGFAQLNTCQ